MSIVALAVRSLHLATGALLLGALVVDGLAGPGETPATRRWRRRLVHADLALGAAFLGSGLAERIGAAWFVEHGALLPVVVLLLAGRRGTDGGHLGSRAGATLLFAVGMGAAAFAGHAAGAPTGGMPLALVDAAHRVGAAAWLGSLPPLALLLRTAASDHGAALRPFAAQLARRASVLTLVVMLAAIATGSWMAARLAGGVPGLFGTPYGRLVLLKVLVLLPVLGLGAWSRGRLLPRLARSISAGTAGRRTRRRLVDLMAVEGAFGLALLLVAARLTATAPGAGEVPTWPFSFRLAPGTMWGLPGVKMQVLTGAEIVLAGVLALVAAYLLSRWRPLLSVSAAILLVVGLLKTLAPLTVDAYPTTYLRPTVRYTAASVARGRALFGEHCAACHGPGGHGNGPAAASLLQQPADVTSSHTDDHTAGDLFWWLTNGVGLAMPAFGERLSDEERWDLINFIRALSAGERARGLTPRVERSVPRVVAPDVVYSRGKIEARLKDSRGRRPVLLVLYTLPASLPRLEQLGRATPELEAAGARVIALPTNGSGESGVQHSAIAVAAAYGLLARTGTPGDGVANVSPPPHVEFLIDRDGYVRARWIPGASRGGWDDLERLLTEVRTLRQHPLGAAPPDDYVH